PTTKQRLSESFETRDHRCLLQPRAGRSTPPKMADSCLLLPRMRRGNPGKGPLCGLGSNMGALEAPLRYSAPRAGIYTVTSDYHKKLVIVGDGGCGKTSMLTAFATGVFPENPQATLLETVITNVNVGNKKDLRNCPDTVEELRERRLSPVTYKEGAAMAKKIKAKAYMECSALDKQGVQEVFQRAARLAISHLTIRITEFDFLGKNK
ncbi:hypothetical protein HPB47_003261, partial [Ixodes persulcatus]